MGQAKLEPGLLYGALTDAGIGFWTGVPDSLLKHFCAYVTDTVPEGRHVITANEGSAVALATGHYLATGESALVYCQNSGLGNLVNPLLSLADPEVYAIPIVVMIGWRGQPGIKDEPQHRKQGEVMLGMLEAMGVPARLLTLDLSTAEKLELAAGVTRDARQRSGPVALVVPAAVFLPYEPVLRRSQLAELTREQAIEAVLGGLGARDIVVSTTGMTSREVFEVRARRGDGHDRDFLTVGSMGHCSQIALGIALRKPDRRVVCLDGDGSLLMHMGGIATIGARAPRNFYHIVLNNAAHDSVGGQPTVAGSLDLTELFRGCGYRFAEQAKEPADDVRRMLTVDGPAMLEIRVARGARKNLGRPAGSPVENRNALIRNLRE